MKTSKKKKKDGGEGEGEGETTSVTNEIRRERKTLGLARRQARAQEITYTGRKLWQQSVAARREEREGEQWKPVEPGDGSSSDSRSGDRVRLGWI